MLCRMTYNGVGREGVGAARTPAAGGEAERQEGGGVPLLPTAAAGVQAQPAEEEADAPAGEGDVGGGPSGVALSTTVGYTGLLGGPPVIGFLAQHAGLPTALATVALMAGLAAVLVLGIEGSALRRPPLPRNGWAQPVLFGRRPVAVVLQPAATETASRLWVSWVGDASPPGRCRWLRRTP